MGKEHEPQRYAEHSRDHKPTRTAKVNVSPILRNDDGSDRYRNQNGQRSSDVYGEAEREQRNGDQSFAKSEDRSDQRGKQK